MRAALARLGPAAIFVPFVLCVSCRSSGSPAAPDAAVDRSTPDAACPSTGILAAPENPVCPSPGDLATWGQEVPVTAGTGEPPTPAGGTLTAGWYVLVAKTVYGSYLDEGDPPTDPAPEIEALQNEVAREAAYIDCSSMVTLYATSHASDTDRVNQSCRSLVPRALPLGEVTYPAPATGASLPRDPGRLSSYTASGDDVTLVSLLPTIDMNTRVVGSFTIVDRFVLASTYKAAAAPGSGAPLYDASPGPYAPGERDPRCPANPPAQGAPCDPEPVPLQCEYGGDAWARCTTLASCLLFPLDGGGAFQFNVSTTTNCPPNPPECPPDFASALSRVDAGAPASGADTSALLGPACIYTEGICGFPASASPSGACGWMCRRDRRLGGRLPSAPPLGGNAVLRRGAQVPVRRDVRAELLVGRQHGLPVWTLGSRGERRVLHVHVQLPRERGRSVGESAGGDVAARAAQGSGCGGGGGTGPPLVQVG